MTHLFQIRIEFLRVQTYLFAVPRLKDMLGANVLLGKAIRVELPKIAWEVNGQDYQPFPGVNFSMLPESDSDDPLDKVTESDDKDDPRSQYQKGILARDGGHFTAVFSGDGEAAEFERRARKWLTENLPGLRFEIFKEPFGERGSAKVRAQHQTILDLPPLQVCQESGNGPAADKNKNADVFFSRAVSERKEFGKQFQNRESTHDIIGLMRNQFPPIGVRLKEPEDLATLCEDDYLAVIHADGNGVGNRFRDRNANTGNGGEDALTREMCGEAFYHSMRVTVRRAVLEALQETFGDWEGAYRPYQVLMLGGDDLLMICRAKFALEFVVQYAKALSNKPLIDERPLTIGAGVVIASPNLPFHHLHHLAESLAGSAKRLYRGLSQSLEGTNCQPGSVVDWMVNTSAWADDPFELRRRDYRLRYRPNGNTETLLLSGRPYCVLNQDVPDLPLPRSLEGLLNAAKKLSNADSEEQKAARSQLRNLVQGLSLGRLSAELQFDELPSPTRSALNNAGIQSLWEAVDRNSWSTALADVVELYEIQHLGKRAKKEKAKKGEAA